MNGNLWAVVLAAGEGKRLQALTRDGSGRPVPKQFCRFGGERSLLRRTLDRARRLTGDERVVTVVARQHWPWWQQELAGQDDRVVVQPENRGTAAGLLLPLLHVAAQDPEATVAVLPSDHHVDDEDQILRSLREAVAATRSRPGDVVLLGITPDSADAEYGWILPAAGAGRARPVSTFVEKPDGLVATLLLSRGALWNSFLFVGRARTLLDLYRRCLPELLYALHEGVASGSDERLSEIYADLESYDFSRDVLEASADRLRVLAVPECGWSDLGTPPRLARWLGVGEVADALPAMPSPA